MCKIGILFAFLFNDTIVFSTLQIIFIVLLFYGMISDVGWFRRKSGVVATVKRGEKSWGYFYLFYGFALLIVIEIISFTEAFRDYKTIISLIDISILTYLAFFNGWFRNKIIGFIVASQLKEE